MRRGATIEQIISVLEKNGGYIVRSAKALGISHSSLSLRIKKSKRLQDALYVIKESQLDLAESKLITKIREKDLGAICFYLKTQGKKRGYIEKAEFELSSDPNKPLVWQVEVVKPDA